MSLLHHFPIDYQMDSQDCGPSCLKMVSKYYGKYYSLQLLRDKCGITKEGVSLLNLSVGAESIGLHALPIKCKSFCCCISCYEKVYLCSRSYKRICQV